MPTARPSVGDIVCPGGVCEFFFVSASDTGSQMARNLLATPLLCVQKLPGGVLLVQWFENREAGTSCTEARDITARNVLRCLESIHDQREIARVIVDLSNLPMSVPAMMWLRSVLTTLRGSRSWQCVARDSCVVTASPTSTWILQHIAGATRDTFVTGIDDAYTRLGVDPELVL